MFCNFLFKLAFNFFLPENINPEVSSGVSREAEVLSHRPACLSAADVICSLSLHSIRTGKPMKPEAVAGLCGVGIRLIKLQTRS